MFLLLSVSSQPITLSSKIVKESLAKLNLKLQGEIIKLSRSITEQCTLCNENNLHPHEAIFYMMANTGALGVAVTANFPNTKEMTKIVNECDMSSLQTISGAFQSSPWLFKNLLMLLGCHYNMKHSDYKITTNLSYNDFELPQEKWLNMSRYLRFLLGRKVCVAHENFDQLASLRHGVSLNIEPYTELTLEDCIKLVKKVDFTKSLPTQVHPDMQHHVRFDYLQRKVLMSDWKKFQIWEKNIYNDTIQNAVQKTVEETCLVSKRKLESERNEKPSKISRSDSSALTASVSPSLSQPENFTNRQTTDDNEVFIDWHLVIL